MNAGNETSRILDLPIPIVLMAAIALVIAAVQWLADLAFAQQPGTTAALTRSVIERFGMSPGTPARLP